MKDPVTPIRLSKSQKAEENHFKVEVLVFNGQIANVRARAGVPLSTLFAAVASRLVSSVVSWPRSSLGPVASVRPLPFHAPVDPFVKFAFAQSGKTS